MNGNSMSHAFWSILVRDLTLAVRKRSEIAQPLVFFFIVVTLFPFALGPDQALLGRLMPGIIWVAALLASTLSLDAMFRSDFNDGALEQMLLSHHPLTLLVGAKILAHWLLTGAPLILAAVALGAFLHVTSAALETLFTSLLLGTPVLSLIGAIAVALTVGLRGGGMLLTLLILPLYIPVLIFATAGVTNAGSGLSPAAELYFIAGIFILSLTLAPLATAFSLRIRMG